MMTPFRFISMVILVSVTIVATFNSPANSQHAMGGKSVVKNENGQEAQYFIPRLSPRSGHRPLLVVLHDDGESAEDAMNRWMPIASSEKFFMLSPLGTIADNSKHTWSEDIKATEAHIYSFYQHIKHDKILIDQIIITGFFKGATVALSVGLRNPDIYRGVISINGAYVADEIEETLPECTQSRVYLMAGAKSPVYASNVELKESLKERKIPYIMKEYPDLANELPRNLNFELKKAYNWMAGILDLEP